MCEEGEGEGVGPGYGDPSALVLFAITEVFMNNLILFWPDSNNCGQCVAGSGIFTVSF